MKLYTEDQVKQMLEVCRDSDLYEHILTFEDILKTETPIELPIDQSLKDKLFTLANEFAVSGHGKTAVILHTIHNGFKDNEQR